MTFDQEFQKQTIQLIEQILELYKSAGASPRIGQVWNVKNIGDFLCGFFVGEMVGSALSAFQVYHHRESTSDEHMEIVDLVENYSKQIEVFLQNSIN